MVWFKTSILDLINIVILFKLSMYRLEEFWRQECLKLCLLMTLSLKGDVPLIQGISLRVHVLEVNYFKRKHTYLLAAWTFGFLQRNQILCLSQSTKYLWVLYKSLFIPAAFGRITQIKTNFSRLLPLKRCGAVGLLNGLWRSSEIWFLE